MAIGDFPPSGVPHSLGDPFREADCRSSITEFGLAPEEVFDCGLAMPRAKSAIGIRKPTITIVGLGP